MQRSFIVIGQRAKASADFSLNDLPSTSGRLDVLVHALRAALLVSHGVRRDVVVYLVLLGDAQRACTLRVDGAAARYLRPDERSLAVTLKKALGAQLQPGEFVPVRTGIAAAIGGVEMLLQDAGLAVPYVLDPSGVDVRTLSLPRERAAFILGDHLGFSQPCLELFAARRLVRVSVGPRALHTADALAVVSNELDRREASGPGGGAPRDEF